MIPLDYITSALAMAAIPSPRPVNPIWSVVVAVTVTRARSILTSEIALSEDLDEAEIQRLLDVNLGFSEPKPGDEKHHSEAPAEPADRTLARIESESKKSRRK